jgi:IS5 family transposase
LLALLAALALGYAAWKFMREARAQKVRAQKVRAQTLARLRITLAQLDAMDDRAFEFALRDLLRLWAHGLRRFRYRGLARTHVQHVLTAMACNVARVADWIDTAPRTRRRATRFRTLCPATA